MGRHDAGPPAAHRYNFRKSSTRAGRSMCTIITLFQAHPAYPLIIAANRDERYARPSSGPTALAAPPAVVAGRDLEFGGTWFGVNAQGLAVGGGGPGVGGGGGGGEGGGGGGGGGAGGGGGG